MNQNTDAREQAEAGPGAATVPAQAAGGQAKTGGSRPGTTAVRPRTGRPTGTAAVGEAGWWPGWWSW